MIRIIEPDRSQLSSLRTPLTSSELVVLDFFDRNLPPRWEVYIQPHLNGLRPDFVLLHPGIGIAVFEVGDWTVPTAQFDSITGRQGSPLERVKYFESEILNVYCPRLGLRAISNTKIVSVVTAGVIMPNMLTSQAISLLDPDRAKSKSQAEKSTYLPISGMDALDQNDIDTVFPDAHRSYSLFMNGALASDFRTWLVEPDYAQLERQPLPLDDRQKGYVTSLVGTRSGFRRIKGPAGSGKSIVLAARAAWLAAQGKNVLVVTYNITLWHYLRDLAMRYPEPRSNIVKNITWDHFHQWCRRVICLEANMKEEYRSLWSQYFSDQEVYPEGLEELDLNETNDLDDVFEIQMPQLAMKAIERAEQRGCLSTYDAILVDEGQDFTAEWWNALRRTLSKGGEMWLFADDTQGIYGRSTAWTDVTMKGSGFQGRWGRLDGSYRLPRTLVPELNRFVRTFLTSATSDPPTAPSVQLPLADVEPLIAVWRQVYALDDAAAACVQAVLELPGIADPDQLAYTDVTLLVSDITVGLRCVDELGKRGFKVAHTFGESRGDQRNRKLGFFMGEGLIRVTTIHSFKGWETRALIVHIPRAFNDISIRSAYVGMTRLKAHPAGSYLVVVCAAPELEPFGRGLPGFQDHRGEYHS